MRQKSITTSEISIVWANKYHAGEVIHQMLTHRCVEYESTLSL